MERLPGNPLVKPADVTPSRPGWEVVCAFNPGVARLGDETILLLRVAERPKDVPPGTLVAPIWDAERGEMRVFECREDDPALSMKEPRCFVHGGKLYLTSISHLRVARSTDGARFAVEPSPAMVPETPAEAYGIEDPRVTRIGDDFWITYKVVSPNGITIALARTGDFVAFERKGVVLSPENMDCAIFPEKIGGGYAMLTRPVGNITGGPMMWLARSPDLVHWGRHEFVMGRRPGMWDAGRIGASCVPFMTSRGWLEIYHGADERNRYCAGAALLDAEDPSRVIARSGEPLLEPEADYERAGFFGNVVFASGCTVEGDAVTVYYGAADQHTCAARASVGAILDSLGPA